MFAPCLCQETGRFVLKEGNHTVYYNQRNYPNVPYPAKGYESATIKTSGCGVCCASMVVENLTDKKLPPDKCAQYAIQTGARVPGGTDMILLGRCLARDYSVSFRTSNRIADAVAALQQKTAADCMVVVNVGGDRSGHVGLFSDSGHFVVAAGLASDGRVQVLDPNYYAGKFDKTGRRGKVTVQGNICLVSQADLIADTTVTATKYYIFKGAEDMTKDELKEASVKVGSKTVKGFEVDDTIYVPVRAFVETMKEELAVNWSFQEGASVTL